MGAGVLAPLWPCLSWGVTSPSPKDWLSLACPGHSSLPGASRSTAVTAPLGVNSPGFPCKAHALVDSPERVPHE